MSMKKTRAVARAPAPVSAFQKKALSAAITAALSLPIIAIQTAGAQEAPQSSQPEEITVTGSRIVRHDLEANSPLQIGRAHV